MPGDRVRYNPIMFVCLLYPMFFFVKTHSILELTSTSSHNANGKSVPISLKIEADDGQLPNKKGGNDKRGPTL